MKGAIKADHIPVNNYELLLLGLPSLTAIEISGLEDELQTTDLPDRTRASGGDRAPMEMEIVIPMHHLVEQAAMELWYKSCQHPVSPNYKKGGSLIHKSVSGNILRTFTLIGVFVTKRALPDLEMANDGEPANVTWTLSVDDMLPI